MLLSAIVNKYCCKSKTLMTLPKLIHLSSVLYLRLILKQAHPIILAAETFALTKADEQSFYARAVLSELFGFKDRKCLPINVITGNKSD